MSAVPLGVAQALAASAAWGTGDFLGGMAARRTATVTASWAAQATGLLLLALAAPRVAGAAAASDLAWGVGAGVFGSVGLALLYRALAMGTVSTAAPLISAVGLVVPVVVGIGGGERPGPVALAGIALAAIAVALVGGAGEAGDDAGARRDSRRALGVAVASGLCVGGFLVCLARVDAAAGLWPLVAARATGTALTVAATLVSGAGLTVPRPALPFALGAGVADVAANILYVLAAQQVPLSVVATLGSLAPASTVVLAQWFLRERLGPAQRAGVAAALVAVLLLARGG